MLETERLILKHHTMDNAEKMNRWCNDPVLTYYSNGDPHPSEPIYIENTKAYLARIINNERDDLIYLGIHKKVNDVLIGYCMIAFIDLHNRSCKFGIVIGEKHEWHKGYGKEVLGEIMRYCFEDLDMNRIGAEVYAFNKPSINLFEGSGFKREGVIRQKVFKREKFEDEYIYGLLRDEWENSYDFS